MPPPMSQASHWPSQALSQQTPSTQVWLWHPSPVEQLWPLGLRSLQVLPSHQPFVGSQSASPEHEVVHAPPVHAHGLQSVPFVGVHTPALHSASTGVVPWHCTEPHVLPWM